MDLEPQSLFPEPASTESSSASERCPLSCLRDPRVRIEKTYYEHLGGSVVFYEIHIEGLPLSSSSQQKRREICTIHRRYKQFKSFNRKLHRLVNASNAEGAGKAAPVKVALPNLPPLRPKLLVDHSSQIFVSERSAALQLYLESILKDTSIASLILASEELMRWLTDLPQPFYPASKGNCPSLFWLWDMRAPSDISAWSVAGGMDKGGRESPSDDGRRSGSVNSDSESNKFSSSERSGRYVEGYEEEKRIFPELSPHLHPGQISEGKKVDHVLNEKIGLFCGNLWQLTVDAVGLDAPCDYAPIFGSVFAEMIHVAGGRFRRALTRLDECRIGDVAALPCCHGLNLPTRYIMITGRAYFINEHESASYSGLHLSYMKLLEAAVDYDCRTIALDCMFSEDKCYPKDRAAHVALKTVRFFLECYGKMIERVVLVSRTAEDYAALQDAATYYFPRTEEESGGPCDEWAEVNLDDKGDFTIQERAFRIGASPMDIPQTPVTTTVHRYL